MKVPYMKEGLDTGKWKENRFHADLKRTGRLAVRTMIIFPRRDLILAKKKLLVLLEVTL